MVKVHLERKLRAIQVLKEGRYVGTMQAWRYLKAVESVYENPKKVSDYFNNSIKRRLDAESLDYPATPERIGGVVDVLQNLFRFIEFKEREKIVDICGEDLDSEDAHEYEIELSDSIARERGYNNCYGDNWEDMVNKEFPLREISLIDIFYPLEFHEYNSSLEQSKKLKGLESIFYQSQSPDMTDDSFGNSVLEKIKEEYVFYYPEEARDVIETASKDIDWDYTLSKDYFKELRMRESSRTIRELSTRDRIKKVLRDQVEHRIEIRREIISDYFSEKGSSSYESTFHDVKKNLQQTKIRINDLIRLNAPDLIIEDQKESYLIRRYLLTCLTTERSFIKKLLREDSSK